MTSKIIELNYVSELKVKDKGERDEILPLNVHGISIRSGYIENKKIIIKDSELENVALSLREGQDGNGAYILKDHEKKVDSAIGRIKKASKTENFVFYEGLITSDEETARKVKDGVISASSVSLMAENAYCSICGAEYGTCNHILGQEYEEIDQSVADYLDRNVCALVLSGLRAREQSLVLYPAVESANIQSFIFSEETENYIEELTAKKKDRLEAEENMINDLKLVLEVEKLQKDNSKLKTKIEILKSEKEVLEKKLFCERKGIYYDPNFYDLSIEELKAVHKLSLEVANGKPIAQGYVYEDLDVDTERENKKTELKSLIFGDQ